MTTYKPGSFFLTSVTGVTGKAIWLGQFLAGRPSKYEHAGLIIDSNGTTLEAEPGGATPGNIADYKDRHTLISDAPIQNKITKVGPDYAWLPTASMTYEEWLRYQVVSHADQLVGVPYSGLDYLALATLHLHLPSKWIRDRVESSGHMICSQLVDAVYLRAGIHLFTDDRRPGDVMPSDLAKWVRDNG